MEIVHALEIYGFTKKEATVYVFLLKQIEGTAFQISKGTGIPRTTVYTILDSLIKRGVVSQFRKNTVAYFAAESPNQLFHLLKQKEEIISDIMSQIRAMVSQHIDMPVAKLYLGLEGIKIGLEDILETLNNQKLKQICATSQPELFEYLPKYFPNWLKRREDLGVFTKLILPYNARDYLRTNTLREVRYLPGKFPFACSVTMYGNKAAFFSFQKDESYCIIIESEAVIKMFLQFFLFTWEMLGENL